MQVLSRLVSRFAMVTFFFFVMFVVLMMYRSIFARNLVASLFVGFLSGGGGWALLENVT